MKTIWKARSVRRIIHTNANPVVMRKAIQFCDAIRLVHRDFNDSWQDNIIFPNSFSEKMYLLHFIEKQDIKQLPPFEKRLVFYAIYENRDGVSARTLKDRDTKRSMTHHSGNVLAVSLARYDEMKHLYGAADYEAYTALYPHDPNSKTLVYGEVSRDFIRDNCKRIPFYMAITIHPELFAGEF